MRWFVALPMLPLLVCGGICVGGVIIAFILGRTSAEQRAGAGEELKRDDVS